MNNITELLTQTREHMQRQARQYREAIDEVELLRLNVADLQKQISDLDQRIVERLTLANQIGEAMGKALEKVRHALEVVKERENDADWWKRNA